MIKHEVATGRPNACSLYHLVPTQLYGVEWSYGYMDMPGTGVYSCRPKANPM